MPPPGDAALSVAKKWTASPALDGLAEEEIVMVALALVTVWLTGEAVLSLPARLLSPIKTAVIAVLDPTAKVEIEVLAVPPDKATALPNGVPLVLNCTVPVGVAELGATTLTVAVKVTDWPETEGLAEEATVVVVLACVTVWLKGEPLLSLVLKLPSPL